MKKVTILLLLTLIMYQATAQKSLDNKINKDKVLSKEVIKQISYTPRGNYQELFISEQWHKGSLLLKSGEIIKNCPMRYDIHRNMMEIRVDNQIRIIEGHRINKFIWNNYKAQPAVFVNAEKYKKENSSLSLSGFVRIITRGKVSFIAKMNTEILYANYNQALSVGSKKNKLIKSEAFYLVKNNQTTKIRKKRRDVLNYFENKSALLKQYAKKNNLRFRKEKDLAQIIDYYNALND